MYVNKPDDRFLLPFSTYVVYASTDNRQIILYKYVLKFANSQILYVCKILKQENSLQNFYLAYIYTHIHNPNNLFYVSWRQFRLTSQR